MLSEYFTSTLNKLKAEDYRDLTIVIGNESCDLDSSVCAIVYSTFLNWQNNQIKCKVCTKSHRNENAYKDDIFVPILNVKRKEFIFKTEVAFCLKEHGIYDVHLVFRDDVDLNNLVTNKGVHVVLVDHHVLSKEDQFLAPYVTEIIDHRPVNKAQWNYKDDVRSTIELVGSCSTLVGHRIKDLSALFAKDVDFFKSYPICCELLRCAIILDTVNFSKEVDKARPSDVDMVMFLESILKPNNSELERKAILERLVKARSDISALTSAQLLRKDTKILGDFFVPSFPILVREYLQREDAIPALHEALTQDACSVAILLGMCLVGQLKRDIAVYTTDEDKAKKLMKLFEERSSPQLQLSPETLPSAPTVPYFKQLNVSASRKQFMPILNEYINFNKEHQVINEKKSSGPSDS